MPETAIGEWLTPAQAGARVGLTAQRIVQLARAGEVEHVLTPLGRLLDPADVERLAEERRRRRRERKAEAP